MPTAEFWRPRGGSRRVVTMCLSAALCAATAGCATMSTLTPKANVGHAAFIAASAADVISTQQALDAGAQELNPLMGPNPTPGRMAAVKLVGWSLLRTVENTVESEMGRSMRWYERILFWAIPTGITAYVSARNFDVAAQYGRRD